MSAGRNISKIKCAFREANTSMALPSGSILYFSVQIPKTTPITVIKLVYGIPEKAENCFMS